MEGNQDVFIAKPEQKTQKIVSFARYKFLKERERSGKLNPPDFEELLALDFTEHLQDNPPLGKVFSPAVELRKIKTLPSEQRKEALSEYKNNLSRQRQGLAACRVFIERSIEFNNDIPREKLLGIVKTFAGHYGFDGEQVQIATRSIDGYYHYRQKALEIRKGFPDNRLLVNELTGLNFDKDTKFDVSVGPMSIDITTNSSNITSVLSSANRPIVGYNYGGFASQSKGSDPVYYVVTNHDMSTRWRFGDPSGVNIRNHEHEHIKNRLISQVIWQQLMKKGTYGVGDYTFEQDREVKKVILEDIFNRHRLTALNNVKDEFAAMLYNSDILKIQKELGKTFFKAGGPYDFLKSIRDNEQKRDDPLYQEAAQKILVDEYRDIIEKAITSFAYLVKAAGYSTQFAIALLTDKPLSDWPKSVKRLLEQHSLQQKATAA